MVRDAGMEVCCGGIVGMGETLEQRAEFAMDLQELDPTEVPLNFFDPRPGTPFANIEPMPVNDAFRTIGAFRLALPKTILRFAGGRELTLDDFGTEKACSAVLTPSSSATTSPHWVAPPNVTSTCWANFSFLSRH